MRYWVLIGLVLTLAALWADMAEMSGLFGVMLALGVTLALLTVLSFWITEFYIPDLMVVTSLLLVLTQWLFITPYLATEEFSRASLDQVEIPERYATALIGQAILLFSAFAHWVNWRLFESRQERYPG